MNNHQIFDLCGHHLFNLNSLIHHTEKQLAVIQKAQGLRIAQDLQDFLARLQEENLLLRVVASRGFFCFTCPIYEEEKCLSNGILTDDYFGARSFGLRIDHVYLGEEVLSAISHEKPKGPPINFNDIAAFRRSLDYIPH